MSKTNEIILSRQKGDAHLSGGAAAVHSGRDGRIQHGYPGQVRGQHERRQGQARLEAEEEHGEEEEVDR